MTKKNYCQKFATAAVHFSFSFYKGFHAPLFHTQQIFVLCTRIIEEDILFAALHGGR